MRGIFPGYAEVEAPQSDDVRAKWSRVLPELSETDYVRDMRLPDKTAVSVARMNEDVNRTVRYRPEQGDRWQTPQETMEELAGDCEDYAILKYAVLLHSGFWLQHAAMILGTIGGQGDHAFLVALVEGKYQVLDNKFDHLIRPPDYVNFTPKKSVGGGEGVLLYLRQFTIADQIKSPRG